MSEQPKASSSLIPRLVARAVELYGKATSDWGELREGVGILRLAGSADSGPTVALLRYEPGARVPPHRHGGFEVIYVIEGAQSDENGTYEAGTLVVNHEGETHSVWSDRGCLVLIVWERPIVVL